MLRQPRFPKVWACKGCLLVFLALGGYQADAESLEHEASGRWKHKTTSSLSVFQGAEKEIQFTAYWDCCYISLPDHSPVCLRLSLLLISLSLRVCVSLQKKKSGWKNGCLEVWWRLEQNPRKYFIVAGFTCAKTPKHLITLLIYNKRKLWFPFAVSFSQPNTERKLDIKCLYIKDSKSYLSSWISCHRCAHLSSK